MSDALPVVPERVRRQIKDIVRRSGKSPLSHGPWPPGVRRILEREYTR